MRFVISPLSLPLMTAAFLVGMAGMMRAGVEVMVAESGPAALTGAPSLPAVSESHATVLTVEAPHGGNDQAQGIFIYRHLTGAMERVMTQGDALTELNGVLGSLKALPTDSVYGPFGIQPVMNGLGLGCSYAEVAGTTLGLSANEALLRFGGPEGLAVLMAESQTVAGTGRFVDAFRFRPAMNENTGVSWVMSTRATLLQPSPSGVPNLDVMDNPDHALMVWLPEVQADPLVAAMSGQAHVTATGAAGTLGILFQPRINDAGQVLVASGRRAPGELGWYDAHHLHLWSHATGLLTIASEGQAVPGAAGRIVDRINSYRLGPAGEVYFVVEWDRPEPGSGQSLLRWQDGTVEHLLSTGDQAPENEAGLVVHSIGGLTEVTPGGQLAMKLWIGLAGSSFPVDVIVRLTSIGLAVVPLPLEGLADVSQVESIGSVGINDAGMVAFEAKLRVASGQRDAVLATDGETTVEIARGQTIHDRLGFPEVRPVTSEGQVAFVKWSSVDLAGLFTPDLQLRPSGNFWEDRSSFTFRLAPSAVHRVILRGSGDDPVRYFGGPSDAVTVRRLEVGGGGTPLVFLSSGGAITAAEGIRVETGGTMSGGWTLNGALACAGTLSPGLTGMVVNGDADLADGLVSCSPGGVLSVTGNVKLPARVDVVQPVPGAGSHALITSTGTMSGVPVLRSVPPGWIYSLSQTQPQVLALEARLPQTDFEAWQVTHFGSNVPAVAQPEADPDGDLQDNQSEFAAGTLPLDAASRLALRLMPLSLDLVRASWPAREGRTYRVESRAALDSPWEMAGQVTAEVDGELHLDLPTGTADRMFFQLVMD